MFCFITLISYKNWISSVPPSSSPAWSRLSHRESIYCPPIYLNISRLKSDQVRPVQLSTVRPAKTWIKQQTEENGNSFFPWKNVIFPDKILNLNNRTYICVCISSKVSLVWFYLKFPITSEGGNTWMIIVNCLNCFFNWRLECKYVVLMFGCCRIKI